MTETLNVLEQTYKNQYATERISKKVTVLGKIQNKLVDYSGDITTKVDALNTTTNKVSNTFNEIQDKAEKTEKSLTSQSTEQSNIVESLKELTNALDNLEEKNDLNYRDIKDVLAQDKNANQDQLLNIKSSVDEFQENINKLAPSVVLKDVSDTIELSFDELRVLKDERLELTTALDSSLDILTTLINEVKEEKEHQKKVNKQFDCILDDLTTKSNDIFQRVSQLRPVDIKEEISFESDENIEDLFKDIDININTDIEDPTIETETYEDELDNDTIKEDVKKPRKEGFIAKFFKVD